MQPQKLLLTTAVLALGLYNSVLSQAPCSCERRGNTYTVSPADSCSSFTQSTSGHPDRQLDCPAGLIFNTRNCVCDFQAVTECPATCTPQPPSPSPSPAIQYCTDNGRLFEEVNATIASGECEKAAELLVAFDIPCQQGIDRAGDLRAMAPLYSTYVDAGCLGSDVSKISSLEPACAAISQCTITNPEMDFLSGCGVNNQVRYNVLECYTRVAAAGCRYATVSVKRYSKFLSELCPTSCETAGKDDRTRVIARSAAEARRCDLAMTLLWDDTVSCNDSADLSGAFQLGIDTTRFFYQICDKLPEPVIEQRCWPLEQCFQLTDKGSFVCGASRAENENTIKCLSEITKSGCYFTPSLSDRFSAHCPNY